MKLIMPKLLFAVRFKRRCHWIMLESGEKREEEKRFFKPQRDCFQFVYPMIGELFFYPNRPR